MSVCMLCTVCQWCLDEDTHQQQCSELGLHKNDRQAELLEEIEEVRICGLVRNSDWAGLPGSVVTCAVSGCKLRSLCFAVNLDVCVDR